LSADLGFTALLLLSFSSATLRAGRTKLNQNRPDVWKRVENAGQKSGISHPPTNRGFQNHIFSTTLQLNGLYFVVLSLELFGLQRIRVRQRPLLQFPCSSRAHCLALAIHCRLLQPFTESILQIGSCTPACTHYMYPANNARMRSRNADVSLY